MTDAPSTAFSDAQPRLSLLLLGSFEARSQTGATVRFHTTKSRALLAFLAVEADTAHARSGIVGLLWPDMPEETALRNLSKTLSRLRESLGETGAAQPFVLAQRDAVQWNPDAACDIDVAAFAQLANRADLAQLQQALRLYRGEFLHGFGLPGCPAFEEWVLIQRERFARLAAQSLETLAVAHTSTGSYGEAIAATRRLLSIDPWRESAHRQLMQAYALNGQRAEALAQFNLCKTTLAAELGMEPDPQTTALAERIRAGDLGPRSAPTASPSPSAAPARPLPRHNLPAQLSSFIGREQMLADVCARLRGRDDRLITLTGMGGVGKSRLALAIAGQLTEAFADGVWFIPLAGVESLGPSDDSAQDALAAVIAHVLGITPVGQDLPQQQLLKYISALELLLVLDNFEHLMAGVGLIATLLQAAPGLRVLVTSREQLNIEGEGVNSLRGLGLASSGSA